MSEHAVIVDFPLKGDFPDDDEWQFIEEFEEALESMIAQREVGEFDGNEMGAGTYTIFMYGPDADALFDVVRSELKDAARRFGAADVTRRYGPAEDENAREVHEKL